MCMPYFDNIRFIFIGGAVSIFQYHGAISMITSFVLLILAYFTVVMMFTSLS